MSSARSRTRRARAHEDVAGEPNPAALLRTFILEANRDRHTDPQHPQRSATPEDQRAFMAAVKAIHHRVVESTGRAMVERGGADERLIEALVDALALQKLIQRWIKQQQEP